MIGTTIATRLRSALRAIDSNYGPLYVASAILGGSLVMEINCDTTSLTDSTKVHGDIFENFKSGLLKIDAGVTADYSHIINDVLKNGTYSFFIRGGSNDSHDSIQSSLRMDKAKIDVSNIHKQIGAWMKTIPTDLTSKEAYENIAAYEQSYAPIWALFPSDYSDVIRGYFLFLYKDRKTMVDLHDF